MNITAKECGLIADGMGEDLVLGSLLGLCLLPDVACSLCVDLVTMPWQLSRYKDFPEKRTMDPSLVKNSSWSDPTCRGAAVPEILRSLRSRQTADDALGVLQVTFPVSHRPSASQNPSASQKAKEDI